MSKISNSEKNKLKRAMIKGQLKGLKSYSNYLHDQLVSASKSQKKKAYQKYIENQITLNDKKIEKAKLKLK